LFDEIAGSLSPDLSCCSIAEEDAMTSDVSTVYRFPGMQKVDGNFVHPAAVVGPDVRLGKGNFIAPFAVVVGNVELGDDNWIGPHVTIGTAAQYATRYELKDSNFLPIRIGSHNTFREYTTVHEPSKDLTLIEDECYFMSYSHISHDTVIRSKVLLSNSVQIGGFTEVQYACTIGLSTTIHQFTTIGAFSMVGMSSVVTKDLEPFRKWVGNPVRFLGINHVGLKRNGIAPGDIQAIEASALVSDSARLPDAVAGYVEAFRLRNAQTARPVARAQGQTN
jgi:UDP-N-acetylglucosamine acyltransferase